MSRKQSDLPRPDPSIAAIFREIERKAINSSLTWEPSPTHDTTSPVEDLVFAKSTDDIQDLITHGMLGGLESKKSHRMPPAHTTPDTLPASPFFSRLLRFAHARPAITCVRDVNGTGKDHTHLDLVNDALSLRARLRKSLPDAVLLALDRRSMDVYIGVLAPGGYEYAVAMVAILALGAAAVPISVSLPASEGAYFVRKAKAVGVLCAKGWEMVGAQMLGEMRQLGHWQILSDSREDMQRLAASEIKIATDAYIDENAPGVVIFTSGTTGPPKGAVMRRAFVHDTALAVADHYGFGPEDTMLHLLPVHHATGVGINFFPALASGCVIEFRSGHFDPKWTWRRIKRGDITIFSGVPTIYMRMQRHFETTIASRRDAKAFIAGARKLKVCMCGTSALPKPIADWWETILQKKILLRYGATEFGAMFKVRSGDQHVPDGSVGNLFPGYDARLLGEDGKYNAVEGEICVKAPAGEMFSKYLDDPVATARAHTSEGYFKTGDIARKEGEYYFILGRASVDIIKSGGYKISALDLEREILSLDYVSEVMVVGVADFEFGERVAAAVVLKGNRAKLSIDQLRDDLQSRLARYKLPTVLRILESELPKGQTGKVVKKVLKQQLFPAGYEDLPQIQVWQPNKKRPKL